MAQPTEKTEQTATTMAYTEGKYLTFTLADEEYGIGILKIKEIIGMMPITSLPRMPASVKGVVNLRGKVIPIIDLRIKFGMAKMEDGVKILLDIDRVLNENDFTLSKQAA